MGELSMGFIDSIKGLFKRNKKEDVPVEEESVGKVEGIEQVESVDEEVTVESLAKEQEVIDKLYEAEGLSDRVLDMQVALNEKRNKYDISDKKNLNSDGWSQ